MPVISGGSSLDRNTCASTLNSAPPRQALAARSNVSSAGTNTSSSRKSKLPLPRSPATRQLSMIVACSRGTIATIIAPPEGGEPGAARRKPPISQSAWPQPLANDHWPLTRYPPATGCPVPRGPGVPTTSGRGRPGSKTRRAPASGSQPPAVPVPPLPTMTAQAVAVSVSANSSSTSQKSSGSSGVPPSSAGVLSQNAPSSRSVSMVSAGRFRSASARSPAAANSVRLARTAAISSARAVRCRRGLSLAIARASRACA